MASKPAWKNVNANFGSNAAMTNAIRGIHDAGTIFGNITDRYQREAEADRDAKLAQQKFEETKRANSVIEDLNQQKRQWEADDRRSQQEYSKRLGQGPQILPALTESADFVTAAEEVAYTPEELKILNEGKTTPAIKAKTIAQLNLSNVADNYAKGGMLKESRAEMSNRALNEMLKAGVKISPEVLSKHESILSSDVEARKLKQKAFNDTINAQNKQLNSLKKELAKTYNVSATDNKKRSKQSFNYFDPKKTTYDIWLNKLKDKVGYPSINTEDINNASKLDAEMDMFNFSDDKKAYILANLVNHGIDNSLPSVKDAGPEIYKFSKQYDELAGNGYKNGADKSKYQAELNSQIDALEQSLNANVLKAKTAGLSAKEGRDTYIKSLLGAMPSNKSVVSEVDKNEKTKTDEDTNIDIEETDESTSILDDSKKESDVEKTTSIEETNEAKEARMLNTSKDRFQKLLTDFNTLNDKPNKSAKEFTKLRQMAENLEYQTGKPVEINTKKNATAEADIKKNRDALTFVGRSMRKGPGDIMDLKNNKRWLEQNNVTKADMDFMLKQFEKEKGYTYNSPAHWADTSGRKGAEHAIDMGKKIGTSGLSGLLWLADLPVDAIRNTGDLLTGIDNYDSSKDGLTQELRNTLDQAGEDAVNRIVERGSYLDKDKLQTLGDVGGALIPGGAATKIAKRVPGLKKVHKAYDDRWGSNSINAIRKTQENIPSKITRLVKDKHHMAEFSNELTRQLRNVRSLKNGNRFVSIAEFNNAVKNVLKRLKTNAKDLSNEDVKKAKIIIEDAKKRFHTGINVSKKSKIKKSKIKKSKGPSATEQIDNIIEGLE